MNPGTPAFAGSVHCIVLGLAAAALVVGCAPRNPRSIGRVTDAPEAVAYLAFAPPAEVRIGTDTRPVSLKGDAKPDGLEAIVVGLDAAAEQMPLLGTFRFELQSRRQHDMLGTPIGSWTIEVADDQAVQTYRDPLSYEYHFPLELAKAPLVPGHYVLTLVLQLPGGERRFSRYEFEYDGRAAPPPSIF